MRLSLIGLAAVSLPLAVAHSSKYRAILRRNETEAANDDDAVVHILGPTPQLPFDPNTSPYCTYWIDNNGEEVCAEIPEWWGISMADFLRWNPSVTSTCGNFKTGQSYCVEVAGEPPVTSTTSRSTTTQPPTSTITSVTTTTTAGNGVTTPEPYQPGMVANCNKFYFVNMGDTCDVIASANSISFANLLAWNPEVKSDCTGLWAEVNVCVGVIGFTPTTTRATTTSAGNGIATPAPIQPGMVGNCDAFHKVASGNTCATIASQYGVSVAQLTTWNPEIGAGCTGIWLDYYICVSIVGVGPSTTSKPVTTTTQGNGIATPTPIQPGMVGNCDAFHKVASGNTCATLATQYGVTLAQLTTWNPQIGSGCTGMWLDYYICVSIVGVQPSRTTTTRATTTAGNGVTTPTPYQEGMVRNCRIFRRVVSGDTCATIAQIAGITVAQFVTWNPAVGSGCTGLWLNTYACIGLI